MLTSFGGYPAYTIYTFYMVRNRFAIYVYHYTLAYPFTFTLAFTYILRASHDNKRQKERQQRQSAAPRQFPHKPHSTGKWP